MSQTTSSKFINALKSGDQFHVEMAKLDFALELKRVMDREGINKTDLAERLSVSRPMVSKLLRGDANLTIETMVKACRQVGGQIVIKIVRDGCSARFFELAKTTMARPAEAKARVSRDMLSHSLHLEHPLIDAWQFAAHFAANDFDQLDESDEIKPLAA